MMQHKFLIGRNLPREMARRESMFANIDRIPQGELNDWDSPQLNEALAELEREDADD